LKVGAGGTARHWNVGGSFIQYFLLASPLFALVWVGFALVRWGRWSAGAAEVLGRFTYAVALPAMLFRMMSGVSRLPAVDVRLLLAFFGGCLIVFILARFLAWRLFALDGVAQSVFAMGGVFSNNGVIGIGIALIMLGERAAAAVSLVLVFNSLILWMLVTSSVEWARHGEFSLHGFGKTLRTVLTNPIVASILAGSLWSMTGVSLPTLIDRPLALMAQSAVPLALVSLGMALAGHQLRDDFAQILTICLIKLAAHPLVVWLLAKAIGLPTLETQVVTMLASLAMGSNVYMMALQFDSQRGPIAAGLVLSTFLSAFTTPLALALAA
jgi:hypothetical protein